MCGNKSGKNRRRSAMNAASAISMTVESNIWKPHRIFCENQRQHNIGRRHHGPLVMLV